MPAAVWQYAGTRSGKTVFYRMKMKKEEKIGWRRDGKVRVATVTVPE